jgi:hypothetical protein
MNKLSGSHRALHGWENWKGSADPDKVVPLLDGRPEHSESTNIRIANQLCQRQPMSRMRPSSTGWSKGKGKKYAQLSKYGLKIAVVSAPTESET